jgi:exonuclease III
MTPAAERDMSFGTWNVRGLYRSGSLMTVARELGKYKLDLVGVQEVMWDKEGTVRAREYTFFYGQGQENRQLGKGFFVHQRIVSAIKRVEFVSARMSYIVLRGRWCNIIVLNADAPTEEKCDDSKNSSYEELEAVFNHFPKYHVKILLGDFNAKWGERILSNRQLEMTDYIRIVMIMVLE